MLLVYRLTLTAGLSLNAGLGMGVGLGVGLNVSSSSSDSVASVGACVEGLNVIDSTNVLSARLGSNRSPAFTLSTIGSNADMGAYSGSKNMLVGHSSRPSVSSVVDFNDSG
jgi:hypothetical protein